MSGQAGPIRRDGADLLVAVRLTPRAGREGVSGVWTDAQGARWLQAAVNAPPDKGRANDALVALLATALDAPRTSISLEAGATARLKRLRIRACSPQSESAARRLADEA